MGLYFNTEDTIALNADVNTRFDSDNIDYWRDSSHPERMAYFDDSQPPSKRKKLYEIANLENIHAKHAKQDGHFQKWLIALHKTSVGDTIRAQILQGLKDANCGEIVFVLIPSGTIDIASPTTAGPSGAYSLIITISTVTWDNAPAFIKAYRAKLAAKRDSRKKKR